MIQKPDADEVIAVLYDTVQKVFQKMLESMAWSFRKQPEEGLRVLAPSWGAVLWVGVLGPLGWAVWRPSPMHLPQDWASARYCRAHSDTLHRGL